MGVSASVSAVGAVWWCAEIVVVAMAVAEIVLELALESQGLLSPPCGFVLVYVSAQLVARVLLVVVVSVALLLARERRLVVALQSVVEPIEVWLSEDTVASTAALSVSLRRDLSVFPDFPVLSDLLSVESADGGRGSGGAAQRVWVVSE